MLESAIAPSSQPSLTQLASQCPIVVQAGRFATWVGDGRPVTAKGVIRRSDLPEAAAALGVEIPERVLTAARVKSIHRPWTVAEAAGMITVGKARAVASPDVAKDPLEVWSLGLEAVLRAESTDRARLPPPVGEGRGGGRVHAER